MTTAWLMALGLCWRCADAAAVGGRRPGVARRRVRGAAVRESRRRLAARLAARGRRAADHRRRSPPRTSRWSRATSACSPSSACSCRSPRPRAAPRRSRSARPSAPPRLIVGAHRAEGRRADGRAPASCGSTPAACCRTSWSAAPLAGSVRLFGAGGGGTWRDVRAAPPLAAAAVARRVRAVHEGTRRRYAIRPSARFLEQALKAAPGYDAARLALWELHTEQGEHQRALDAVSAHQDRQVRSGARRPIRQRDVALAAEAGRRSVRRAADDAERHAAGGGGQRDRRRAAAPRGHRPDRAAPPTTSARRPSSIRPTATISSISATPTGSRRTPMAAAYWLREAVRRDPADGDAHFVLSAALQQTGATAEAARERELAHRLSSRYAQWEARAASRRRADPAGARAPARAARSARGAHRHDHHLGGPARPGSARRVPSRRRHAARSSAKPIAKRRRSCGARCTCRRTWPKRTCCWAGSCLAGGRGGRRRRRP